MRNRQGKQGEIRRSLAFGRVQGLLRRLLLLSFVSVFLVFSGCSKESTDTGKSEDVLKQSGEGEREGETGEKKKAATEWKLGRTDAMPVVSVSSSSELVEAQYAGKYVYPPAHILDGDPATCWAEAVEGSGIDESLAIGFREPVSFDEIQIVNGLGKNRGLYMANNRIQKMEIQELYNKLYQKHTHTFRDEETGWQSITFAQAQTVESISFIIRSVYKGNQYDDTCISDIRFLYEGEVIPYEGADELIAFQEKRAKKKVQRVSRNIIAEFRKHYAARTDFLGEAPKFYSSATGMVYQFSRPSAKGRGGYNARPKDEYFHANRGKYRIMGDRIVFRSYVSYVQISRVVYIQPSGPDGFTLNGIYYKRLSE